MGMFDRVLRSIAPDWAASRQAAKVRLGALAKLEALQSERQQLLKGPSAYYDGASRSHRTAGRRVGQTSADKETYLSLARLRDVSRELVRNNALAKRAVEAIANNAVGDGITESITTTGKGKSLKDAVMALIRQHLRTPAIDFDGRHNIYGLQNLAMRTVVESGEALIVRYRPPAALRLSVPLQVRVLEPDYLNPWLDRMMIPAKGNYVVQGIEFDPAGRRVAYHLFDQHPGSFVSHSWNSHRIPAEDVIHLYRVDRPGQSRGVPWGAAVFMRMWDLGDFLDAELLRQKIAACFAVFWTDNEGRVKLEKDEAAGTTATDLSIDMLEPGMQQRLPPGVDVKFAVPPSVQGFEHYLRATQREVAIGFGVPYEVLSADLGQVNFSSGRMGWLEFQRNIKAWQSNMLIPHMCDGLAKWFLEAAEFTIPGVAGRTTISWTPPRREMIDPTKEIPAIRDGIRAGLMSRPEEVRKLGYDPAELDAEIADDNKTMDQLGLRFDSDGRFPVGAPAVAVSKDAKLPGDAPAGQK